MRIKLINNFRDLLLNILRKAYVLYKKYKVRNSFKRIYRSDMVRYLKYSRTFGADDQVKMTGSIILQYHVIEKGLTMPDLKMGFGKERVIALCRDCVKYIQKYGQNDEQVEHAIGVILEYECFHKINGFDLNNDVDGAILQLKNNLRSSVEKTAQIRTGKNQYFSQTESPFPEFANSRCSVRNYSSEEVNIKDINDALELARNTPSACNRQSWRTYVFTRKDMIPRLLEIQGGNRGFGHLANKLIIVTGELGLFCNSNERNQVYIDGGLYAMNLLYTLHYLGIAACVLNCSFDPEKDRDLKKISGIKDSEVLIVMIACGIPKDEFIVALSPRYPVEKTNSMIN